jgi:transposase
MGPRAHLDLVSVFNFSEQIWHFLLPTGLKYKKGRNNVLQQEGNESYDIFKQD